MIEILGLLLLGLLDEFVRVLQQHEGSLLLAWNHRGRTRIITVHNSFTDPDPGSGAVLTPESGIWDG
jgi:hypothetical protein